MARQFARGGPRRKTQWAGFGTAGGGATLPIMVVLTAGTTSILSQAFVVSGGTGIVDEETTITRTLGIWSFATNLATAAVSGTYAIGLAVVRNEALAAGVGSLPSVESDPDFEWLYYAAGHLRNPNSTLQDGPLSAVHMAFDVRGQRIVRKGSTVVWLAESETIGMVAGVAGRYLLKLT